jgi:hypothetical protein
MLRLRNAGPRTNKKPPLPAGRRGSASGLSFCSADTLTYEENGSCDAHAVTIAALEWDSNSARGTSWDPEGPLDALVNACFSAT